ncbi:DNA recombination protein RmuC [Streptococcus sp. sy010]|uniref:DNA recombination protein RmuC n=1 Tax=Streptococcus sp. sy010 TaxID=2600148 RepID=UPI0011B529EF|nr:DNA recombination protein RmuC [Streptococcus sp. sy010]TWT14452.1 DNA recombination protein RmuC [Streptococcus sp. sy010]
MEILFLIILICLGLALIVLYRRLVELQSSLQENLDNQSDRLSDQLTYQLDLANKEQLLSLSNQSNQQQAELYQQLTDVRDVLNRNLTQQRDWSDKRMESITQQLNQAVHTMQTSNEERLEQIRQTVEEKLEQTLHRRLQASFETVSLQLENVNKGLGEMQNLARDVGSLSKVLSGSKTRGILGELQLGQIIEDMLSPQQYEREFATVNGSQNRVEYAIKLPGQAQGQFVYLPVDAKFPLDDYYRLEEAYDLGDKQVIAKERKQLLTSIKGFAKDIANKYLNPPETTQFAILFLPTEGLYAEVVRQANFFDALRREQHILVAGPSTLAALLNSLSVGFKTLNIQKNAHDISKILGNVKTEFGKFGGLLEKTQKQLRTASNSLDSLMTTRTNAIVRALDKVDSYQDQDTAFLLGISQLGGENNEN